MLTTGLDSPRDALLRLVADPNSPCRPYVVVVHDSGSRQTCYLGPHTDHVAALRCAEVVEELCDTWDVSVAPLFTAQPTP